MIIPVCSYFIEYIAEKNKTKQAATVINRTKNTYPI